MRYSISPNFFVLGVFLVASAGMLLAEDLQVDSEELVNFNGKTIQFINYVGPYDFINTQDQIRNIGRFLGLTEDLNISQVRSVGDKYRILHLVNPEIAEGLDADVFIIGLEAAVDHINNLRHILASYLETSYAYTAAESSLLAEFITLYNAVYRADKAMVEERYKEVVIAALEKEKIGLSKHYTQWSGKTQILIPLRLLGGDLGSEKPLLDTAILSDSKVIDQMRQEEDQGLESRRGMVDLREEQLDAEQASLNEKIEDLERREEENKKESAQLEEEQDKTKTNEKKKEIIEEKIAITEEKVAINAAQEELNKRTEDVITMREEIAADENERINTPEEEQERFAEIAQEPFWFLLVDDLGDGIPFGRVLKYNLENRHLLAVSKVTAVRGRRIIVLEDAVLAIVGKQEGNASVRLLSLDLDNLDTLKEGSDDIFPGSLMVKNADHLYLVTKNQEEWHLGRFDASLERRAISKVVVDPWTSLTLEGDSLFVQGKQGEIHKLSLITLQTEISLE